jgi:uncharacterized protein DUF2867
MDRTSDIRLPNAAHEARPWRMREIAPDFIVEDVWALPVRGSAGEFQSLIELLPSLDPSNADSLPTRALWRFRDLLGKWFALGRVSSETGAATGGLPIPGRRETSLRERLPDDLRDSVADLRDYDSLLFTPVFRTDVEFAAEISNQTMHGAMHLGWVEQDEGRYQGQMAVYVKPRGTLGKGYMALIKPFRHWIVYPALMRQVERAWDARAAQ